jgi:hypothetical protein
MLTCPSRAIVSSICPPVRSSQNKQESCALSLWSLHPEAVPEKLSWVDPESETLMSPPPCPKASPAASPSVTLVVRPPATSCPCLPVVSRFSKRLLSYLRASLPPSLLPKKYGVDMVIKVKQGICRRSRHSRVLTRKVIGFGILLAHCWSPCLAKARAVQMRGDGRFHPSSDLGVDVVDMYHSVHLYGLCAVAFVLCISE